MMSSVKGFKVTDANRKVRVGIAVRSLDDLRKKTIAKFNLQTVQTTELSFQTPDGTLVETDEYLNTLPAQTLLIWLRVGERAETDAEILYRTIREVNEEYLTAGKKVQEFFTEKMKSKVYKLAEVLRNIDDDKLMLSFKDDHPEWFEGLDTRAKTKEEYMFRRAQDRIRGYYYKTKDELRKNVGSLSARRLDALVKRLQQLLHGHKYFGHYFDRRYATTRLTKSLCDDRGKFHCAGGWNVKKCPYVATDRHVINPYASRETRIIFQTWNLDHAVERSRAILPAICDALSSSIDNDDNRTGSNRIVNVQMIFDDLFTLKNLKFVHVVCHDKGAHNLKAGPYLM